MSRSRSTHKEESGIGLPRHGRVFSSRVAKRSIVSRCASFRRHFSGIPLHPVVRPSDLSIHRSRRIRVVAKVDREQRAVFEGRALRERPQRGFEGRDDVAGAADVWGLAGQEGAGGDVVDLRRKGLAIPEAGDGREERSD